jgi:hypothetical protein
LGTREHKNIARSPPPLNSLGIFFLGRSLKIQREIKREVFTYRERKAKRNRGGGGLEKVLFRPFSGEFVKARSGQGPGMMCAAAAAASGGLEGI